MQERVTRREFAKLVFWSTLGLLFHESCVSPQKIPEYIIPNDGRATIIDNVNELSTKLIGIERIFVFRPLDSKEVIVFLDRSKNTRLTLKAVDRKTAPIKDGFTPFDLKFDINKALEELNLQYSLKRPRVLEDEEYAQYTLLFGRFSSNPPGIIANYDLPKSDSMYVFGFDDLYTINGRKPPTSILKAKFKFL